MERMLSKSVCIKSLPYIFICSNRKGIKEGSAGLGANAPNRTNMEMSIISSRETVNVSKQKCATYINSGLAQRPNSQLQPIYPENISKPLV